MKAIFHSADFDGKSSAAIIKYKYPHCELIPYDYGGTFPWEKFYDPNEEVFMVDVSLPIIDPISGLDMMELDRKTMLTWIDHHKTVMDAANAANFNPEGIREIGKAACELTWEYLFPHEDMPEAVYLLGKYDIWDHADKPRVMPFQYGMKVLNTNPNNQKLWGTLFAGGRSNQNERLVDDIIRDGRLILEYTKQQDKSYAHGYSFDTEVCGKKALAINKGMANSHLFEYVWDNKKYDLMISFCMKRLENGEFVWRCTMYSDKPDVDVGEIAKTFGGGGHFSCSGFQCKELPFKLN